MRKLGFIGLMFGLLLVAALGLGLSPHLAAAAPLPLGFTSTPVPTDTPVPPTPTLVPPAPTPTNAPPNPPQPPAETPVPVVYDPLVTKLVNVTQAQVGDVVQFTIVVTNPNPVEVVNVVVVDPLPPVVDFVDVTVPQGTYAFSADTNTLTFNLGTLAPNQVLYIVIQTRVNSKGQAPDQFRNLVHLTWADGHSGDSNPVTVSIIPSRLPAAGQGPGWREVWPLAAVGLAGVVGILGFSGIWLARRRARPD